MEGPDLHLLRLRDPRLEILKRPEDLLPRGRRAVRSDDEARVRELVSRRFDENVSKRRRDRNEALVARLRREHLARGERAPHVELVSFEIHVADLPPAVLVEVSKINDPEGPTAPHLPANAGASIAHDEPPWAAASHATVGSLARRRGEATAALDGGDGGEDDAPGAPPELDGDDCERRHR